MTMININDKVVTNIDSATTDLAPSLGAFKENVEYHVFGVQYAKNGTSLSVLISPDGTLDNASWVHESFLTRVKTEEEKKLTKEQAILQLVREGVFELKFKGI